MSDLITVRNIAFKSYDYHMVFLFSACVVYALFGSPTPDSFGFPEFFIGLFFILAMGFGHARDVVYGKNIQRFWKSSAYVFLIYGLTVPVIVAAVANHGFIPFIRDLIPFLFLFLPLFVLPSLRQRPHYFRALLVAVILIGLLFSLRSLFMRFSFSCNFWCTDELLYLENMPTVLFSALFLLGSALRIIAQGLNTKNLVVFLTLIFLALLPLAAMALTLQRASLGAVILYLIVIQGLIIYKSPVRGINAFILCLFFLVLLDVSYFQVLQTLFQKTADVGLNMRPQEMAAVWGAVTINFFTFLFGLGWGSSFINPAVGNLSVTFTHNFFSSIFLKAGLLGLVLACAYIAGLLERLMRVVLKDPVFGFALSAPILIDLTFYASFKSLDFGLMLLMVSGSLVYMRQCKDLRS